MEKAPARHHQCSGASRQPPRPSMAAGAAAGAISMAMAALAFAIDGAGAGAGAASEKNPRPPGPRVFWASAADRTVPAPGGCPPPAACQWVATDEEGRAVGSGAVGADGAAHLVPAEQFGVGFYRVSFSRAGVKVNETTAAVLRDPSVEWPLVETPVGIDTAQAWLQPSAYEAQLAVSSLAAAAGCGWTRDRLAWAELEPKRGVMAPAGSTRYDNATRAARAVGARVLEVFHSTPAWAVDGATDAADGVDGTGLSMPRDLRDVHSFVTRAANRFGDAVAAFEPWNEGNSPGFGGQTTDQRASHQKAAWLGFQRAASPPFVCNNVLAEAGTNTTAELTAANGVTPYFQSYNIHSYDAVEQYPDLFEPARKAAAGAPVWLTECGIHLPAATAAPWSDMTPENDVLQAEFIGPSYAVSLYAGVRVHFFFVLSNYLERGLQYGLVRHDLSPRPGYSALAAVGYFLANATAVGKLIAPPPPTVPAALPTADGYAARARPGGGAPKDVVVVYCPPPAAVCATPPSLLDPRVRSAAVVFDYLGRDVGAGVPGNVTASCLFVVLPAGTAGSGGAVPVTPPLSSSSSAASSGEPSEGRARALAASTVVLQAALPYLSDNDYARDTHVLDAAGRPTTFYVYNFGDTAITGSVSAACRGGATVTPSSWSGVSVAPGERVRLEAHVSAPGGRQAVSGDPGAVTLTGDFGEPAGVAPPRLSFLVRVDPSTLTPAEQRPCAGAAVPGKWVRNVVHGGSIDVTAPAPGCIRFGIAFNRSASDAWAYPELDTSLAGDRPMAGADGVRYTLQSVGGSVPVTQLNAIFFDANGTQYLANTNANASSAAPPQRVTVLLRDAVYDRFGPPGPPGIGADGVARLAVGLNLGSVGSTAHLTLCNLSWVRF